MDRWPRASTQAWATRRNQSLVACGTNQKFLLPLRSVWVERVIILLKIFFFFHRVNDTFHLNRKIFFDNNFLVSCTEDKEIWKASAKSIIIVLIFYFSTKMFLKKRFESDASFGIWRLKKLDNSKSLFIIYERNFHKNQQNCFKQFSLFHIFCKSF